MTTKVKASVLENTAVTAGTYGGLTQIPTIIVDAQGRITSAANNILNISAATITDSQITSIANTKITGVITAGQIVSTYSEFASGTAIVFYQQIAPTGWTKSPTNNDKALRVVSGTTGGSAGGTVAFSTAFSSKTPAGTVSVATSIGTLAVNAGTLAGTIGTLADGAVTLTTAQIPSHQHTVGNQSTGVNTALIAGGPTRAADAAGNTGFAGGGGSHTHGITGAPGISGSPSLTGAPSITSATFTGTAIDLAVQYVDVIIATKNV